MNRLGSAFTAIAFVVFSSLVVSGQASRINPDVYAQLRWRHIGPEGNRVSAVAGVPGDPLVYYAGSASGGIRAPTIASSLRTVRLHAGEANKKCINRACE